MPTPDYQVTNPGHDEPANDQSSNHCEAPSNYNQVSPESSPEHHLSSSENSQLHVLDGLPTTRYNSKRQEERPVAPAHRPFHYPGWDGPGYPKGLGHGPIVWRYDNKKNKMMKIEGMSYESLKKIGSSERSAWQKMLDEQPYDAAGQLRIMRRGVSGTQLIVEWNSDQAALIYQRDMNQRASGLNDSSIDVSYTHRPRVDDRDSDDKMMWPSPNKK
jgi:hypothetical protein